MLPSFQELLTLSGFTLRGTKRATCARCSGGDQTTLSYNDEVAHCFRCGWSANRFTIAKELGLFIQKMSAAERAEFDEQEKVFKKKQKRRREFLAWQNRKLDAIIAQLRELNLKARLAREILVAFPEEESAWGALADLHSREALLFSSFDYFACAQVSRWLEFDSDFKEVVNLWINEQSRRS